MRQYVYDSGALIAIERLGKALQDHEKRIGRGNQILVPSPVAAQVVREPRRQARLMLTLRGCRIVPFAKEDAAPVGRLLGRAGTADVVDGFVVLTAAKSEAAIVSADGDDMKRLLEALGMRLPVLTP